MTMTNKLAAATLLLAVAALPSAATAAAKPMSCVRAGGTATSPTEGIARFMANAALENSIKGQGRKQIGAATVKCDGQIIGASCTATAKACK